jgi:predicted O-methyltransferase YrrM
MSQGGRPHTAVGAESSIYRDGIEGPVSNSSRRPEDVGLVWTFLARGIAERIVRPALRPALEDFQRISLAQSTDGVEILAAATGLPRTSVQPVHREAYEFFDTISHRPVEGSTYRMDWRMELEHAAVLYGLVRLRKPSVVFETGIADGFSSRVILTAIAANGSGRLVSLDVRSGTGGLVPRELRGAWRPRLVDPAHSIAETTAALRSEAPIDLFLHDSRHTYGHMLGEYRAAWPCLRPGGLLGSDDADSTFAFLDFARAHRARIVAHVGSRKVFGLIAKPTGTSGPPTDGSSNAPS